MFNNYLAILMDGGPVLYGVTRCTTLEEMDMMVKFCRENGFKYICGALASPSEMMESATADASVLRMRST